MERRLDPYRLDPTGRDIHAEAARLRERGPATLVELPGEVVAWAVTGYGRLRELLADPRVSKDPRQHWPQFINGEITQQWPLFPWVAVQNMFTAYGSDHKRLRTIISKAFTVRRVTGQRPRIEHITAELLDQLATMPAGEIVDLRETLAYPLPIEVICQLFGVPDASRPRLRQGVEMVFNTSATSEEAVANLQELYTILHDLVALKRRSPDDDDLTTGLIAAYDDDGSRLTEAELVDTLFLMISAGHETTVNLLDQAITALLTHPEQLAFVRTGQQPWEEVIEETLRWQAPVANLPLRYAVEDIDVDGVVIPKGDAILAAYGAAGRDSAVHGDDADRFDITRTNKDHLSFGHGVHFCVGAPLARLEAGIALPELFERFPELSLAVEPSELAPVSSFIANGHRRLPVLLRPPS